MTPSRTLDRARIDEVITAVADRVAGEFLLVGGGAVALWLEPRRVTEDIDIIGFNGDARERFALMDVASDLGLPIEAVNSAADFFVFRIPDWRAHVVPLRRGRSGTVYRPDATLLLLLKVARLSETDLDDCLAVLRAHAEDVDAPRVRDALRETGDRERDDRVVRLRALL